MQKRIDENDINYDHLIKLMVIGDSDIGKTTLLHQYTDEYFYPKFSPTVGIDFKKKRYRYVPKSENFILGNDLKLELQLWDTAGQERFRSLSLPFYRDVMGFIILFDITKEESFQNCRSWIEEIKRNSTIDNPQMVLAGNKSDLDRKRKVDPAVIQSFAREHNLEYFEVSAANGHRINEVFSCLVEKVMHHMSEAVLAGRVAGTVSLTEQKRLQANKDAENKTGVSAGASSQQRSGQRGGCC